jgi:putative Mg2+ transporter-C (MgtC) family protein
MPTTLTWQAIALRLLLTTVCAGILGFDRDERGHAAGFRTNLLVGLAACLAMLQANWLINSNGKPADSFVVMDIMRFPLGILSGIGFIGAGAILRRGELAVGVTTAATIWFITVMGLCFGGGQLGLGLAGFGLGLLLLTAFKKVEGLTPRWHTATLTVHVSPEGPTQSELAGLLSGRGLVVREPTLSTEVPPGIGQTYGWKIRWRGRHNDISLPASIQELSSGRGIQKLELTR